MGLLKQAAYRRRDAVQAINREEWAYAARLAQECVELYIKGLLALFEIDFPRRHDVSSFLETIKEKLPEKIQKNLKEITLSISLLHQIRSPSFYGAEATLKPPDELIDRKTAEDSVTRMQFIAEIIEDIRESF